MKTLTVRIEAELQVPDDWELVEHSSGITALKVGNQFVDFDITPLATPDDEPEAVWSDDDQVLTGKVLDCVTGLDSDLEISYQQ